MICFACPSCVKNFKVKDEFAGRQTKCPACGQPILVPATRQPPPPPAWNPAPPPPPLARLAPPPLARLAPPPLARLARGLEVINDVIPDTHRHLLMPDEKAFHFEWMDTKGGCGTTQSAKKFMLITDKRVLYEAAIKEGEGVNLKYVRTSGSIPVSKISFVGTSSAEAGCNQAFQTQQGCNPQRAHLLKVNSGGGNIEFPFFSEQKAKRIQRVIEELISST